MKGPYENGKVYAIAAVGSRGFANGVVPAVFASDRRTGTEMFFGVNEDEFDVDTDTMDISIPGQNLRMDSNDYAGWRLSPRAVLSLWSQREEALQKYKERSERGKRAKQTAKANQDAARMAAFEAMEAEYDKTPAGRIEKHRNVASIRRRLFRVRNTDERRDLVILETRLNLDQFRQVSQLLGIDSNLVEEYLVDSAKDLD